MSLPGRSALFKSGIVEQALLRQHIVQPDVACPAQVGACAVCADQLRMLCSPRHRLALWSSSTYSHQQLYPMTPIGKGTIYLTRQAWPDRCEKIRTELDSYSTHLPQTDVLAYVKIISWQ